MQKTSSGKKIFIQNAKQRPSHKLSKSIQKIQYYMSLNKALPTQPANQYLPESQPNTQQTIPQNVNKFKHKLKTNSNFQYYLFERYNNRKQLEEANKKLEQFRNSQSVKNLLDKQLQKSSQLDYQINKLQQSINLKIEKINQIKSLSNQEIRLENNLENNKEQENNLNQENIQQGQNMKNNQNRENNKDNLPFYKKYKPISIQNDPQLADYGQFYGRGKLKRQKSPSHNFQKLKQNKFNLHKYRSTKGMVSPSKSRQQQNQYGQSQKIIDKQPKYNRALSPYQFKNTIQGRLLTRSNHNLRLDMNKTQKINNVNKIWYKVNDQTQKKYQEFRKMRKSIEHYQKLKKCHSFDSYKGHKLFQSKIKKPKTPAQQVFYDPDGQAKDMNIYTKWKTQNHLKMQKATSRPQLPKILGTNLDYDVQSPKSIKSVSKKKKVNTSSSQRVLKFTREIINPARGCYR